jgi:hypothetical protein
MLEWNLVNHELKRNCYEIVDKGKGNIRPGKGHEGPEGEQRFSSTLSLTSTLDKGGWLMPRPGRFSPGN